MVHNAKNGETILDVAGSKLIRVTILGWANKLCQGHDSERGADRRLHVVI